MNRTAVKEAVAQIGRGGFVIVVDDVDRENEGDLVIAAEKVTPEAIAFMVRYTSGLICVPTAGHRLDELELPLMVSDPTDTHDTAFTISVDYRHGTTTGISAADRAATIRALADSSVRPGDLARPGHVFPLRYCEGGVLKRPGHTEAAVDLARLAGLNPVGAVCEVVTDEGTMARGIELERFAKEHELPMISISDLIEYRLWAEGGARPTPAARPPAVERHAESRLPTRHGDFRIIGYTSKGSEIVVLMKGEVAGREGVLVRLHSECVTGDVLGSLRCDCGYQLDEAMRTIADHGRGIVVYFRGHEGRGIGLMPKLAAYALQDEGWDTVEANEELGLPADGRDYRAAAAILSDLGVETIRLMTNNPDKQTGLEAGGIRVIERISLQAAPTDENSAYLAAKADKLGHIIDLESHGRA